MIGGSAIAFEMPTDQNNRGGLPAGGPYAPPGGLYDNEQTNGTTSLASQDSSTTFTARSADDFILTDASCSSGQFEITRVRVQNISQNAAPQDFRIDFFNDNGSGTAPESGMNPFATVAQNSQTLLGPFGASTSLFEADFMPAGLILDANTVYWISSFGVDAAANSAGFNAYFGASPGATGTTENGVIIAPGAGIPDWTPVETVTGPPALAFSFAIDGTCVYSPPEVVPTLGAFELFLMALMLGGVTLLSIRVYNKK